jgi:arylsulfatase
LIPVQGSPPARRGNPRDPADTGSSVTSDYDPPFRFDGRIHRVIVDVSGEHVEDYESQMRIALAKQ